MIIPVYSHHCNTYSRVLEGATGPTIHHSYPPSHHTYLPPPLISTPMPPLIIATPTPGYWKERPDQQCDALLSYLLQENAWLPADRLAGRLLSYCIVRLYCQTALLLLLLQFLYCYCIVLYCTVLYCTVRYHRPTSTSTHRINVTPPYITPPPPPSLPLTPSFLDWQRHKLSHPTCWCVVLPRR